MRQWPMKRCRTELPITPKQLPHSARDASRSLRDGRPPSAAVRFWPNGMERPMSNDCLKVSIADNIATVTIDRPPVNALDQKAMAEFTSVFGKLWDLNDVRVVILTNTGKIFCGGMDLKTFGGSAPKPGEAAEYFAI